MTEKQLLEHADYLRRLVRGLVLDRSRVEDVVQETYLRALSRPPRHSRNLRGWLATVARNLAFRLQRDASRRARREERAGRPDRQPPTSDVAARVEAQKRIAAAVDELDEPYRTAIVHRYLDGMTPAEIAKRLGVPVKTVKTRLYRGLERLRARLDRDYGDRAQWSLLLLPLALPRGGATVAAGVTVLTMKKIVAALIVLCVAAYWTVSRVGDPSSEMSASRASIEGRERTVQAGPPTVAAPPEVLSSTGSGFVFSGRVVDPNGDGVPRARVRLVYWGSTRADSYPWGGDKLLRRERERVEDPRAITDGQGYFRIERPYASRSFLLVEAEGFGSLVAGPYEPDGNLKVVLDPQRRLRVNVVDPDGSPVADALVRIIPSTPQHAYASRTAIVKGRTNEAGRIDLPHVGAESVTLEVAPREPHLGFVDLGPLGKTSVTVTVPRLKTRTHRIVDARTREPLPDAYAIVSWSGYQSRSWTQELSRRRIEANADGVIRFPLQKDFYGHLVSAPGYEVSSLDRDVVPLQRSMRVVGVVLDTNGDSVAGAAILIASPQGPAAGCFAGLPLVAAWSDPEGRFSAEIKLLWPAEGAPDPGIRSIMAVDSRHGCAIVDSVKVRPGTRSDVTLRFPRPATLTIEIVGPDGAPRPNHWLNIRRRIPAAETWARPEFVAGTNPPWLMGQRPETDAEGRAVIDRLPPGEYDIDLKFHRRELTIREGEDKLLRVVRGAGPSISGRVLDEQGEPVAQVMIGLSGPTNAVENTDEDGRFNFEDVNEGEHKVGFRSRRANSWIHATVAAGADITLREPKELASLRISVEGPPDGKAEYAYTTSAGSDFPASGYWNLTGSVDETPTFIPSRGILVVRAPGYAWKAVAFEAQAGKPTEVRVRMPRAGSVKGDVDPDLIGEDKRRIYVFLKRTDGYPQSLVKGDQNLEQGLGRCLGDVRFSGTVEDGRFELADVAPGPYEATLCRYVEKRWVPLAAAQRIEVRSGLALDLTFVR